MHGTATYVTRMQYMYLIFPLNQGIIMMLSSLEGIIMKLPGKDFFHLTMLRPRDSTVFIAKEKTFDCGIINAAEISKLVT